MENTSGAGKVSHLSLIFFLRRETPPLEGKMSSCFILSEYVVEETAVRLALIQKLLPGVCDLRRRMKFRLSETEI